MKTTFTPSLIVLCTIINLIGSTTLQAQDPAFSQFYNHPVYLNPALAGSDRDQRFILHYRNQWTDVPFAFNTYALSYDRFSNALSGGVAVSLLHDVSGEGALATTGLSLTYATGVNLNRKVSWKVALQPHLVQNTVNWNQLTWSDQIDDRAGFVLPTQQPTGEAFLLVDFGAGTVLHSDTWQVGFAVDHFVQPYANFLLNENQLQRRWTVHGSYVFRFRQYKELELQPDFMVVKQGVSQRINLGLSLKHDRFSFGVRHLFGEAITLFSAMRKGRHLVGYSYDINVARIRTATTGSNELHYRYSIPYKQRRKRYKTLECPSF